MWSRSASSPRSTTACRLAYHRSRGWPDNALDAGTHRLRVCGLIAGETPTLTTAGADLPESIERATDLQQVPILDAIGSDLNELVDMLAPWAAAIIAAGGFPKTVEQIPPQWGRLQ